MMISFKQILRITGILILAVVWLGGPLGASEPASPTALQDSLAYSKFLKRPQNELSKMYFLIERFQDFQVTVLYEKHEYSAEEASRFAKRYLAQHYRDKDTAESWIKRYCYRSQAHNQIIHLRFPDGRLQPARDVLLQELGVLNRTLIQPASSAHR